MANRQAYQDKLEAQLKEWKAELDELSAKALKADADARIEISKRVDQLTAKYHAVQDQFSKLASAGEEKWNEMKQTVDTAVEDFKREWQRGRAERQQERSPTAKASR